MKSMKSPQMGQTEIQCLHDYYEMIMGRVRQMEWALRYIVDKKGFDACINLSYTEEKNLFILTVTLGQNYCKKHVSLDEIVEMDCSPKNEFLNDIANVLCK